MYKNDITISLCMCIIRRLWVQYYNKWSVFYITSEACKARCPLSCSVGGFIDGTVLRMQWPLTQSVTCVKWFDKKETSGIGDIAKVPKDEGWLSEKKDKWRPSHLFLAIGSDMHDASLFPFFPTSDFPTIASVCWSWTGFWKGMHFWLSFVYYAMQG